MAKGKKAEMNSKLSSFGDILANKESNNIPMQKVSPVKEVQTTEKITTHNVNSETTPIQNCKANNTNTDSKIHLYNYIRIKFTDNDINV